MFCIDVFFFISIISFFISFISLDNTQKTIYRTAKKKHVISCSFTGRFRRAVVSSQDSSVLLSSAKLIMKESSCSFALVCSMTLSTCLQASRHLSAVRCKKLVTFPSLIYAKKYFATFATLCFAFDPSEPKDCSLLSDMSQRYISNVDFSETQIIIWVER